MPEAVDFQTKPAIALDQIRQAVADGVAEGVVLADATLFAGDGRADMKFQAALLDLELAYVLGVQPNSTVWPDGKRPLPAKELARSLPASDCPSSKSPSSHAALPIRPERHTAQSIATMRWRIATEFVRKLSRCPCCLRKQSSSNLLIL